MKKSFLIILCIAFVLIIGIIALILLIAIPRNTPKNVTDYQSYSTSNPYSSQENLSGYNSSDIFTMTSQTDVYTIKAYQGHIGVFLNSETEPFKEYNVLLDSLPKEDQDLLQQGIQASTQGELRILLEDYIS